ncbi:hypothetical protein DN069_37845 [Streptacidiphilus pinicola]|uniref:Uncharacterized protein n=1 Tax=Streptacidiphilus pinicola TaxID=2219663 RepID=A0A2X0IZR4_9ACTN|nr:hypothetical protein DN069_37845 [Streptacidiphilus pinicola]
MGAVGAQQAVAAGLGESAGPAPAKSRPGGTSSGFTVRLPDGRMLHFSYAPAPGAGAHRPPSGRPGSGAPPSAPSGSPSGTPSAQPSPEPPSSELPVPVISSLFPSPKPSGSGRTPAARPSRGAAGPRGSASAARTPRGDPALNAADAVVPGAMDPPRPSSTVPPPLGPQAVLHPDTTNEQIASARSPVGGLGHRARLLGVGLALIGTGAALFGWRIRRL